MERAGLLIRLLPGDVAGFELFLSGKGVQNPAVDDLLAYPVLRRADRCHRRHGVLAAGAYRRVLVRLGAKVQAVLSSAWPWHPGLTHAVGRRQERIALPSVRSAPTTARHWYETFDTLNLARPLPARCPPVA
jgi:hypothetical protein